MASLNVQIDRDKRIALFWGPGTFQAKDLIKTLGAARWDGGRKVWEVRDFSESVEFLQSAFPDVSIEEISRAASDNGVSLPAASPSLIPAPVVVESSSTPVIDSAASRAPYPDGYSVLELSNEIRKRLKAAFPGVTFVHGAISALKRTHNGRVFIELSDPERPELKLSAVIWRNEELICGPLRSAGFELEVDLQVMFKVQIDLNPRGGAVSLNILGVVPEYTLGKLAALREKTNERLRQEGIFQQNKMTELPFLPMRLGLITSAGGTVINDFRASLDEAKFGFSLLWMDTAVQGSSAKEALVKGIEAFGQRDDIDAILVFRGGGSPADLAVFSEYEVARAVCLSPLPVLSAIGHQEDQCSVQDVSYRCFGVPKDLGRFFADIILEHRRALREHARNSVEIVRSMVEIRTQRLHDLTRGLSGAGSQVAHAKHEALTRLRTALPAQAEAFLRATQQVVSIRIRPIRPLAAQACAERIAAVSHSAHRIHSFGELIRERARASLRLIQDINRTADWNVRRSEEQVQSLERVVLEASPETQLRRGFSLVKRAEGGEFITTASGLKAGEEVELQFSDGTREATIK